MNVLDLFSGIGGFSLGLERAGMNTVAFCEILPFCQKVLAKNFENIPIFNDIKSLTQGRLVNELGIKKIDVVCGGFPCQPFSIAGQKKSTKDDRDLWPEMFRIIAETRPTWVIGENVSNFINLAFTRSKTDLEGIGYTVRPFVIPACAVGAGHRRERVWIIAHLNGSRLEGHGMPVRDATKHAIGGSNGTSGFTSDLNGGAIWDGSERRPEGRTWPICPKGEAVSSHDGEQGFTSNIDSNGLGGKANATAKQNHQGKREGHGWSESAIDFGSWWPDQSGMGRAIHGFSDQVDKYRKHRIAALGNSIVPQIAEFIGMSIMKFEREKNANN